MAPRYKCYGGPLHGETIAVEHDRFEVLVEPRLSRIIDLRYQIPPSWEDTLYRYTTYAVELCREQRGNAYREMNIAVIEGHKNLLQHEKWEIESDIHAYHWSPIREPSFLRDFDSWFAWCAYRHTNHNAQYLTGEFRR